MAKCQFCNNPATVHLTQIVQNQMHKVDLCEACAEEKGVTDPDGFSIAELVQKSDHLALGSAPGLKCAACGFTPRQFRESGRLGCPECYESFKSLLSPYLRNMQIGQKHAGKAPRPSPERERRLALQSLRQELEDAVADERFEQAAELRDEILRLEEESSSTTLSS